MLPIYGTYSKRDIPSGSELLHPFPVLRAVGPVQMFFLEFHKDGAADLGDKFADGGTANQHTTSDTARRCMSLQWPGVSGLLPVPVQLLMAS